MPADDSTSPNGSRDDDPYAALVYRHDHAQRELDESVAIMNADAYLMTSQLPGISASKDQALHELTTALTALKAAERVGNGAEIERGQWGASSTRPAIYVRSLAAISSNWAT